MAKVIIYGKATCPYTRKAREATPEHEFVDVQADPAQLARMLALSGGKRRIPVIVDGETVTIGFGRGS